MVADNLSSHTQEILFAKTCKMESNLNMAVLESITGLVRKDNRLQSVLATVPCLNTSICVWLQKWPVL